MIKAVIIYIFLSRVEAGEMAEELSEKSWSARQNALFDTFKPQNEPLGKKRKPGPKKTFALREKELM